MVQSAAGVSRFAVDLDWAYQCGPQLVEEAVRSWVPKITGFRVGSLSEDRAGADFVVETPSSEIMVDAKYRRKDYRPLEDDVALEVWANCETGKVGWTRDRSKKTDLVVWVWKSSGRTLTIPFRVLCDVFLAKWKEWCHNYRTEKQMSEKGGDYWTSQCVFVPLSVLRLEMQSFAKMRMGIDLTHCLPADMRFCRQPNCPQTAMYPCKPERALWCYRHYEESRSAPVLHFSTTDAVRAVKVKVKSTNRREQAAAIGLRVVDGGQEKLF